MKNLNKNKGFTLVEFVIVIFVFSLFMTSLFQVTDGGIRAFRKGVAQTEIRHQTRQFMEQLSADLKQAVPAGGTTFMQPPFMESTGGSPAAVDNLNFTRYIADTAADPETDPPTTADVKYYIDPTSIEVVPFSGKDYRIGSMIREYAPDGGTTEVTVIAENVVLDIDGVSGNFHDSTWFMWRVENPPNNNVNDLGLIVVNLVMIRPEEGNTEPETMTLHTTIHLGTDEPQLSYQAAIGSQIPRFRDGTTEMGSSNFDSGTEVLRRYNKASATATVGGQNMLVDVVY
ncbi:MAG: type II secretion system protein J [Vulcanimicrobiota bacterium]